MKKIKDFINQLILKKKSKKVLFLRSILLIVGFLIFYQVFVSKGSSYNWLQGDWSGGAETGAVATHTSNQTGWTKFFSKDTNVDTTTTPGEITLSDTAISATITETLDADFNAGTKDTTYVASDNVYLLKPSGASCTTTAECDGGWCDADTCSSSWMGGGICSGIEVYYEDISSTKQWKTANTDCDTPQCGIDGGQDGDNLVDPVANPSVDFSLYPAQNSCKTIGGRLPTKTELDCIYTNKASLGNNFVANSYWSSTEYTTSVAWRQYFLNGDQYGDYKTGGDGSARCVR